jgi:hypothetical protein
VEKPKLQMALRTLYWKAYEYDSPDAIYDRLDARLTKIFSRTYRSKPPKIPYWV